METLNKCFRYIFFGKTDASFPPARRKSDLNQLAPDNWSFIEDPLKKNLADYLTDNNITESKVNQNFWTTDSSPPLTSFLDEYRMENQKSRVNNDEFKFRTVPWHSAKAELTQNNSVGNQTGDREVVRSVSEPIDIDMNPKIHDCYEAATQCSSKLEELKLKLLNKSRGKSGCKTYIRKPKKLFVDSSSTEDCFEGAFESDDCEKMSNTSNIKNSIIGSIAHQNLNEIDGALVKTEGEAKQKQSVIIDILNEKDMSNSDDFDTSSTMSKNNDDVFNVKKKRSKRKNCKFFRIPSQNSDSDAASSFEQSPIAFTSHIDLPSSCDHTPSSLELPISFRHDLSSESLERKISTTESEDSFIQFCDNGEVDSCSEDSVFESSDDDDDDDEDYGTDSDYEAGDINSALSKSLSNLTDDSLYVDDGDRTPIDEDQVDCAIEEPVVEESEEGKSTGILLNNAKKLANKDRPQKVVRFSSAPPRVKVMRVWAFAARCARAGHWERYVVDRDRFKKRTSEVEAAISWVFDPKHREEILKKIIQWQAEDEKKTSEDLMKGSEIKECFERAANDPGGKMVNMVNEIVDVQEKNENEAYVKYVENYNEALGNNENIKLSDDDNKPKLIKGLTGNSVRNFNFKEVNNDTVGYIKNLKTEDTMTKECVKKQIFENIVNSQDCDVNMLNENNNLTLPLNGADSRLTNKKEAEEVRKNGMSISHVKQKKEDQKLEDFGSIEKHRGSLNGYIEETHIVKDFIIPTHKFNIPFGEEVNLLVKDKLIRFDSMRKRNCVSQLAECGTHDKTKPCTVESYIS